MERFKHLVCIMGFIATFIFTGPTYAGTALTPGKEDVPEAQRFYSPYVERTAQDKNFAEGLYWGDTHLRSKN